MGNYSPDVFFVDALVSGITTVNPALITAYPGYPITPIFEKISETISRQKQSGVRLEWSINETVALENAAGACFAGARSLVLMKNHGTNTVLDPLVNLSYIGVKGGLLVITADDLQVKASHNDSDSRLYGWICKIPVLEPATPTDAYHFIILGYELSESCNTPVFIRIIGDQLLQEGKLTGEKNGNRSKDNRADYSFSPDCTRFFVGPANWLAMKRSISRRLEKLKTAKQTHFNRIIKGDSRLGVICGGHGYNEAVKRFPGSTILKYGITFPISLPDLDTFLSYLTGGTIYIVENQEPLIEMQVKDYLYQKSSHKEIGENSYASPPEIIPVNRFPDLESADRKYPPPRESIHIRLCPACPARAVLLGLKVLNIKVMGDAGCTALGCLQPFESVHSGTCMGASIATAAGVNKVSREKVIALIGDSAFFHSGLPGLLNESGKSTDLLVILFNNNRAAMTGNQITFAAMQTHSHSSEQIRQGLLDFGIAEKNIGIIGNENSLDLLLVKNEISRFYRELTGLRILIVSGQCPYNINDFWKGRITIGGEGKVVRGTAINPGCFACEEIPEGNFLIYTGFCKGCTQCLDLTRL